jgi:hypothetical protein
MAEEHPRRIVRRAVLALTGVVLLPAAYISIYISLHWPYGRGTISYRQYVQLSRTVFWPAGEYSESNLPGGHLTERMCRWMHGQGSGVPVAWEDTDFERH